MKIWWQSSTPIHRLHDYRNTLTAHLESVKRPGTEIHINGVDDGSMDLHYNTVVAINSYGLWFPAGTPAQYVTRIQREAAKALEDTEIKRAFLDQGFVPVASTSAEFTKTILGEIETNRRLAARIGLTPE